MNRFRRPLAGGASAAAACVLLLTGCDTPTPSIYAGPGSYARYTVTYANGYAGQGYYYGPANLNYYSYQPGIVFYRERQEVPKRYWVNHPTSGYRHPMRAVPPPPAAYAMTLGNGYAGHGYYYGPPGLNYYDRKPGILYFRTRAEVPSLYWR